MRSLNFSEVYRHSWLIIGILAFLVAIPLIFMVITSSLYAPYYNRPYGMMGYYGFGWLAFVWVAVIGAAIMIVLAISVKGGEDKREDAAPTSLEILKKRLAMGEITVNEYSTLLEKLGRDDQYNSGGKINR